MTTTPVRPPSPPVIGGTPALHSGEDNHPVTRVVIHSAVMPCRPGAARTLALMNTTGATGGSWHYATDPLETIQCSYDRYVCHHAPPNDGSIAVEMADVPSKRLSRWLTRDQRRMLRRTARLTAQLCLAYDLPLVFLGVDQLRGGRRGITTHDMVSQAWGQSTHWDPGAWPRKKFMRLVRRYAAQIEAETKEGTR